MNIQQALQQASQALSETSLSASLDAQVLLTHILQCNTAHLAAWPEKKLSEEQASQYLQLIQQRIKGVPVAHLTGTREFWSLNFNVDDSTLIPRPETEILVGETLKALDRVTVQGQVFSQDVPDTTFQGSVSLRVFDSARATTYTTKVGSKVYYLLPGATLFRGSCLVEEGNFEATFVVPKDISYGGRMARISAYLNAQSRDGLAYIDSLPVQGTASAVADTIGPAIELSIAGKELAPGDLVPSNSTIVAYLEDENGINITGEVGHWIVLTVDEDAQRVLRSAETSILREAQEGRLVVTRSLFDTYASLVPNLPDGMARLGSIERRVADQLLRNGDQNEIHGSHPGVIFVGGTVFSHRVDLLA